MKLDWKIGLFLLIAICGVIAQEYQVGVGIYDITGPAAEVGMMGYAQFKQKTAGIHFRLRARAYVVVDADGARTAIVNMDLCMTMEAMKLMVVERLHEVFGTLYNIDNVLMTGTHTHSGPGGFSWYTLYDISSWGFNKENFDCIVEGVVEAISQAHYSLRPGRILINQGTLYDSNINRSPYAYLANPEEERALYPDGDTDKTMTVLRFEGSSGEELGMLSFFSVHCTSMNNTNLLISGDNKGAASYMFEKLKNGPDSLPGTGPFVAAFAQSNSGDVSPNTRGPHCPDGNPCDFATSTCNGRTEECIASGPGNNMEESTWIIGQRQFDMALNLYETATTELHGKVDFRHKFVDFTNSTVQPAFASTGQEEHTCRSAMGYSFAAGTTDGPGDFSFTQGDNNTTNPFWNFLASFIAAPTPDQIACQHPKPILLDVGQTEPLPWAPPILPLQIVRIGQFALLGVPSEPTTMSGRRMRNTVRNALVSMTYSDMPASESAPNEPIVVIAGLANGYSSYVATFEEYQVQRYEGASTMYGPHTLALYQQTYFELAVALATNSPVEPGPYPMDLRGKLLNFLPGVIFDTHPITSSFGAIHQDVNPVYSVGDEVTVVFWGANPRNNLTTQGTFLTVDRQEDSGFRIIRTDGDWDTKFMWESHLVAESLITIKWNTANATPGVYRIRHFGYYKPFLTPEQQMESHGASIHPYSGTSSTFQLFPAQSSPVHMDVN